MKALLRRFGSGPGRLVILAASMTLALAIAHVAGLRQNAGFLAAGWEGGESVLGLVYVLLWFATILVAPVLVLGAALWTLALRASLLRVPR